MNHGNDPLHSSRLEAPDLGRGHAEVGVQLAPRTLHQASDPECSAVGSVQGLLGASSASGVVDGDDGALACLGSHRPVDSSARLGPDCAMEYPGDPMEGQRCEVEFLVSGADTSLRIIRRIQHNSSFDPDGLASACQEWTGKTISSAGSGRLDTNFSGVGRRTLTAHRLLYAAFASLEFGIEWWEALAEMDESGLEVDHMCTNPPCVNIDHLQLLTKRENLAKREWRNGNGRNYVAPDEPLEF